MQGKQWLLSPQILYLLLPTKCYVTGSCTIYSGVIWSSIFFLLSHSSSGSTVPDYGLDDRGSIPDRGRAFFFQSLRSDRPAVGPTQPPIQWVLGVLFLGVKRGRGMMLTTHPHLVPRLRMSRSYPPPTNASMVCGETAYLTLTYI
jgi:hypothetical protein